MADRTILAEAVEALVTADRVDGRACPDRLLDIFRPGCADCEREAQEISAVVLRVVEGRFRSFAERYREAGPKQRTLGAQWSATEQAIQWDFVADLVAKGLPAEETTDA